MNFFGSFKGNMLFLWCC